MVSSSNRKILSRYKESPPTEGQIDLVIRSGPLYPVDEVLRMIQDGRTRITTTTRRCERDLSNLGYELDELKTLIPFALSTGRYQKSVWCECGRGGASLAACDSYTYTKFEFNEATHKELPCDYYIKFAIADNDPNILLVSFHTS